MTSMRRTPNDHTSDLIVNRLYSMASGAVHFTGNLLPAEYCNDVVVIVVVERKDGGRCKGHESIAKVVSCLVKLGQVCMFCEVFTGLFMGLLLLT